MDMITLFILAAIIVACLLILGIKGSGSKNAVHEVWPYKKRPILTETELKFYKTLLKAFPEYYVFAQVSMSQILKYPREWHNRIGQKSIDFLVCGPDGSALLAVEIDDKSHVGRNKADQVKEKALSDADIRLVRWHAASLPSLVDIRKTLSCESHA